MSELRPYQLTGAQHLASRTAAYLADDMGLGKSAQAISACDTVRARNVLVLCPASVCENWRREFRKFSYTDIHPVVYSYNSAQRKELQFWADDWDVLICDEAHYLKNAKAKRTQMVFGKKCDGSDGIVNRAKRVILLSGTPMPNDPSELWPMLRACAPEIITGKSGKPYNFWQFATAYCKIANNGFGMKIVGGRNHEKLKERLNGFLLRRTKAEVLPELPPIDFAQLFVEAGIVEGMERSEEAKLVREVLALEGVEGLAKIAPHVATLRRYTGIAKVQPVADWIETWYECGGGPLVVFAYHKEVIDALRKYKFFGLGSFITGDTPQAQRQREIDKFQEGRTSLFVGQINAAGEGITLTAASDVLFVESSWVPKDNLQAAMRVHRIGQSNACMVRFATLPNSIDEAVQRAVMRKTRDISKIFGVT
jgi:SWI/SNF-related matrix-associated actin-dependent regulator 1 of chromatin subfamily A